MVKREFLDALYERKHKLIHFIEANEKIRDFDSKENADRHELLIDYQKDKLSTIRALIVEYLEAHGND